MRWIHGYTCWGTDQCVRIALRATIAFDVERVSARVFMRDGFVVASQIHTGVCELGCWGILSPNV